MVIYTCSGCNKTFTNKTRYNIHLNAVIPCTEKGKTCTYCKKEFTRATDARRHKKTCKIKDYHEKIVNPMILCIKDEIKAGIKEGIKEEMDRLETVTGKKSKRSVKLVKNTSNSHNTTTNNTTNSHNTTTNNNINNTQNNTQNNITVLAFGKENLSYITDKDRARILKKGFMSYQELLQLIHFNEDHPENHNCYISNMKDTLSNIFNGMKWGIDDKDITIDMLKDKIESLIDNMYIELCKKQEPDEITEKRYTTYKEFRDEPSVVNKDKRATKMILYNGKDMVKNTMKKIEQK